MGLENIWVRGLRTWGGGWGVTWSSVMSFLSAPGLRAWGGGRRGGIVSGSQVALGEREEL